VLIINKDEFWIKSARLLRKNEAAVILKPGTSKEAWWFA
jgi:hypothetical protein